MHRFDESMDALGDAVLEYARHRLKLEPVPLDGPKSAAELTAAVGRTITPDGLGGLAALDLFAEHLAPACISTDNPQYLAFIPCAPTEASTLFDLVVGASCIYGGTWMEGAGAVFAENQALRWLSDLAGLPAEAGGVFLPGGTVGNLSALVAARHRARTRRTGQPPRSWAVVGTDHAHSSVVSACDVMDVDFIGVPVAETQRLTGDAVAATLDAVDDDRVFAVVATAGTTNFGIVDDLDSIARVCRERGVWLHVDAAYGGAGLCAPSVRHLFTGIGHADSLVIDPHKWLFAPFDCCALIYRDAAEGRAAHTQRAGYLDVVAAHADGAPGEVNPSDYGVGLTRRVRGLPFWFSLATYGTRAYTDAVEQTLAVARLAAQDVHRRPYLELLCEPDLSVVVFRRLGWSAQQYHEWSRHLLDDGVALVVPTTTHAGEPATRIAVVNPLTTEADIAKILDTLA